MLITNIDKRRQINAWREQHGLPALTFAKPAKAQAQAAGGGGAAADGAQLGWPSAVCTHSKKALEAFCVTCKKSICSSCAIDSARCKSHETQPLAWTVSLLRAEHDAWVQVEEGRPQQLQSECARVDAAADATIARIREEAAELKLELQRACEGDVAAIVLEQAQLLADVELAAASPDGCVEGSEAARCLLAAVLLSRAPRLPPPDRGRFEAAAVSRLLGRIVAGETVAAAGFGNFDLTSMNPWATAIPFSRADAPSKPHSTFSSSARGTPSFGGENVGGGVMSVGGDGDGAAQHSVLKAPLRYDSRTFLPSFFITTILQG
jgi:hypothetical protein